MISASRYLRSVQYKKQVITVMLFLILTMPLNAADDVMQGLDFMGIWRNYKFKGREVTPSQETLWEKFQRTKEKLKQQFFPSGGTTGSHHDSLLIQSLLLKKAEVDREMQDMLSKHPADQHVSIFWGRTGAGKTTLKAFFEEVDTLRDGEVTKTIIAVPNIDPKCGDQGGLTIKGQGIGRSFRAETKKPTFSPSGVFLDLPGVEDIGKGRSQKAEEEIQRAYCLKRVLEKYRKFNLLVTVPEDDLSVAGKGEGFLRSMQGLTTIFPESRDYLDRTTFFVTHASHINSARVFRNRVRLLLEGRQSEGILSAEDRKILEYISSPESRICIAEKPVKLGGLPKSFVKCFDKEGNTHLFDKSTSVDEYTGNIEVSISESGLQYLRKLSDQVTARISIFFADMCKDAHCRVRPLIARHNGRAEELRNQFLKLSYDLSYKTSSADVEDNVRQIDKRAGEELHGLVDQHNFIGSFLPIAEREQLNLSKSVALARFASQLKKFGMRPYSDGEGAMAGYIVGTGDMQKYLQNPALRQLTACGFGALFFDQDLEARGKSLAVFSPFWKVTTRKGKCWVNLDGIAGKDHQYPKMPVLGMDGEPGLSGESGGHFYGMLDAYHDLTGVYQQMPRDMLTVSVNGGNGGNGQHGGDGTNGEDGKDGDKAVLQAVATNRIPWYSWLLMDLVRERKSDGSLGKPGKDSGRGGKGGIGGFPGSITFANPKGVENSMTYGGYLRKGENGKDGESGVPGVGGKNGVIVSGEWGKLTPNPVKIGIAMLTGVGISTGFEYLMRDRTSSTPTTSLTAFSILSSYVNSITGAGWPRTVHDVLSIAGTLRPIASIPIGTFAPMGVARWFKREGWVGDFKEEHNFPPNAGKKPTGLNPREPIVPQSLVFDHLSRIQMAQALWKKWELHQVY